MQFTNERTAFAMAFSSLFIVLEFNKSVRTLTKKAYLKVMPVRSSNAGLRKV